MIITTIIFYCYCRLSKRILSSEDSPVNESTDVSKRQEERRRVRETHAHTHMSVVIRFSDDSDRWRTALGFTAISMDWISCWKQETLDTKSNENFPLTTRLCMTMEKKAVSSFKYSRAYDHYQSLMNFSTIGVRRRWAKTYLKIE